MYVRMKLMFLSININTDFYVLHNHPLDKHKTAVYTLVYNKHVLNISYIFSQMSQNIVRHLYWIDIYLKWNDLQAIYYILFIFELDKLIFQNSKLYLGSIFQNS